MKISKDNLQSSLEESLARHNVPGASIAVLNQSELITAAAGVTHVNTGVDLTPDTVMHIGSIGKVFNATLVMQLVDEGKVDLDERVLRYLPDLRLKDHEALQQMTVKMLLNHTSGIDGEKNLAGSDHDEETIEGAIGRIAELGQLFRPGAEFSYCNSATVIAGYLAQRLTGKSWYRLIRERIFQPLQMEHAATLPEEALLHRASVGHFLDPTSKRSVRTSTAFCPLGYGPAGATLMMSAKDLIAFARAHMAQGMGANGARILSARSAQSMQQIAINNRGKGYTYDDGMGIGWRVYDEGLMHHAGGGPGVFSVLYAHPDRHWAAAILTNAEHGLSLINEFMQPWLKEVGSSRPVGIVDIHLPSESVKLDFSKYVGIYEDVATRFRVSCTPDGLSLSSQAKFAWYDNTSTTETPPARLLPLGDDQFLQELDGKAHIDAVDAFFRIFAFRNSDGKGHMRHLGNSSRLYSRVL